MTVPRDNSHLSFKETVQREKELYKKFLISAVTTPCKLNIDDVLGRKAETCREQTHNFPQTIFIIQKEGFPIIAGRKIMSLLFIEKKINAPHCSQITASMLLGFLKRKHHTATQVEITYHPFNDEEKLGIFDTLIKDRLAEISFPFKYMDLTTRREKQCAPTGWNINPQKAQNLSNGENHFRNYTIKYFKDLIKKVSILYDPACSTGEFLHSLKQNFPGCKTIGQDLSAEMIEYAKNFVDETYTGDAINSPLPDCTVDIMFLRFLNSEIVTTPKALRLYKNLIGKVKNGGYIVLFGHTPLLLTPKQLTNNGELRLIHANGFNPDSGSIFQYYILRK